MKAESGLPSEWARVVVDTNVLLSAAIAPNGAPAALVDRLLAGSRLVFTEATFAELETRIWKPKFDRYLPVETRRWLLRDFSASAAWVAPGPDLVAKTWSSDPDDDAFIRAAYASGAQRLVSGDDDLLCLHPLNDLSILAPRAAIEELDRAIK